MKALLAVLFVSRLVAAQPLETLDGIPRIENAALRDCLQKIHPLDRWDRNIDKKVKACEALKLPKAQEPELLYFLGLVLAADLIENRGTVSAPRCPAHFRYQEGSDICYYDNSHYRTLIARFPRSSFADQAAYQIAVGTFRYYECEGSSVCPVENQIAGSLRFLRERPKSWLAGKVVERVAGAFEGFAILDPDREDYFEAIDKDIAALRKLMPGLGSGDQEKLMAAIDTFERKSAGLRTAGRR